MNFSSGGRPLHVHVFRAYYRHYTRRLWYTGGKKQTIRHNLWTFNSHLETTNWSRACAARFMLLTISTRGAALVVEIILGPLSEPLSPPSIQDLCIRPWSEALNCNMAGLASGSRTVQCTIFFSLKWLKCYDFPVAEHRNKCKFYNCSLNPHDDADEIIKQNERRWKKKDEKKQRF